MHKKANSRVAQHDETPSREWPVSKVTDDCPRRGSEVIETFVTQVVPQRAVSQSLVNQLLDPMTLILWKLLTNAVQSIRFVLVRGKDSVSEIRQIQQRHCRLCRLVTVRGHPDGHGRDMTTMSFQSILCKCGESTGQRLATYMSRASPEGLGYTVRADSL
jgi:hypothetical protein